MPETPNHDYNVPNEGAQDWHVPLNANFEQFDTDLEIRDNEANKGDYEPKQGAKFLATDTGVVYVGDGTSWNSVPTTGPVPTFSTVNPDGGNLGIGSSRRDVPLDVAGGNNWDLDSGDGDFRVGNDDYRLAMGVALGGVGAGTVNVRAKGGDKLNLGIESGNALTIENQTLGNATHPTVRIPNLLALDERGTMIYTGDATSQSIFVEVAGSTSLVLSEDLVRVFGDLDVTGDKNFVQTVDTDDGEKEVVYTATEAGTPHTEASGVAELDEGRAEIDLPEHFGWVTSDEEPLHVQTTPYAVGSDGLAVVERSTDRIVVEDRDGEGDYEFSYTVKGTREGHADKQVVREPSASDRSGGAPAPADD